MATPKDKGTSVPMSEWLKKNAAMVKNADSLYEAINLNWLRIEEAIAKSGVLKPTHITVMIDSNGVNYFLGVDKVQGKWRIVQDWYDANGFDDPDRFNWKPIIDCPLWIRQNFLKYTPDLVKAVYESNAEVVSELSQSIKVADDFLKSIGMGDDSEDLI
ncbi:MAG: hypothetical protein ACK5N9_04680 [Pirellula sp.]